MRKRLTDAQVAEIRRLRAQGHKLAVIALAFGIVDSHVTMIARGQRRTRVSKTS